jgi:hypothetical protein
MSLPILKASTFAAHFCAFGADATNADSYQPFLDLTLKTVLDNQRALAGALSDEPNVLPFSPCPLTVWASATTSFMMAPRRCIQNARMHCSFSKAASASPTQPHFCLMTSWWDLP